MMYFAWNPGAVVDEAGHPLAAGRVTVFVHDTNVPATIYTLEGDTYVNADNPQFLDDNGRLSATLFATLAVYDVKIEKANGDGTYEDFDVFEIGLDADLAAAGSNRVASVSDLMDTDPSSIGNFVTVTDYPVRNYVWDPQSTDTPDGGVVVDSNVEGQGNWILLWDDEMLPAPVYGITPGNESNMAAFLSYADTIGHWQIRTPRICRFPAGEYISSITYTTQKGIYIDRGARFNWATITCPYVIAQPTNNWILGQAWTVTSNNAVQYLSWFRFRSDFVGFGAPVVYVDKDNTSGAQQVTLQGKEVHFFMTPPSWLMINDCIQYVPSAGMIKPARAWVDKLFSVGRNFEIIPHDDVMNPYYEFTVAGDAYPTMRITDDQCVTFHNGIIVKEGISIPAKTVNGTSYPQQWWGYFDDGEDGPVVQIKAKGDVEVTTLKASGSTQAGTLTVTGAATIGGKTTANGNVEVKGHLVHNYGWLSDHRDIIVTSESINISTDTFKSYYPNGTILKVVNYSNDAITVTAASGNDVSVPGYKFRSFVKIEGTWYPDY